MIFFIILAYNSEILSKFAEAKKNLMKHIKTALIGFGYRGKQLLRLLRTIESYEIVGIADINGYGAGYIATQINRLAIGGSVKNQAGGK